MKEIEVRFLEIDKNKLINKLSSLGAVDKKELLLDEVIFYDPELKWREEQKFVRLRRFGNITKLTYKQNRQNKEQTIDSMKEIEVEVSDMQKATTLLEAIGLVAYCHQQKKRHSFQLGEVTVDIDTWPKIPTYAEIEGPSEEALKTTTDKLGLDWSKAVFDDARAIIEKKYSIPVGTMRSFTFDKVE